MSIFTKRKLLSGALALVASPSQAESVAQLTLTACGGTQTSGNHDAAGYAVVGSDISDYSRTVFMVGWGQSNCAAFVGSDAGPYEAHPNVHMMDIHTGGVYRAKDPMLGCNGEHQCYLMRLADLLIAAGKAERVIITNIALGSTNMARWAADGACSHRFAVAAQRFRQHGWRPTKLFFQGTIGEDDNLIKTSASSFSALGRNVAALSRAAFSMPAAPFLVTRTSWIFGKVSNEVQAGQDALVDPASGIFLSADTDAYVSSRYRVADGHLSAEGAAAVAADCLKPTIAALKA